MRSGPYFEKTNRDPSHLLGGELVRLLDRVVLVESTLLSGIIHGV